MRHEISKIIPCFQPLNDINQRCIYNKLCPEEPTNHVQMALGIPWDMKPTFTPHHRSQWKAKSQINSLSSSAGRFSISMVLILFPQFCSTSSNTLFTMSYSCYNFPLIAKPHVATGICSPTTPQPPDQGWENGLKWSKDLFFGHGSRIMHPLSPCSRSHISSQVFTKTPLKTRVSRAHIVNTCSQLQAQPPRHRLHTAD